MIQIFVKTLDGRTFVVDLSQHDTVADVKDKIRDKSGVNPNSQRLVFSGKNLGDTLTVADCGLENESFVWMMVHTAQIG